MSEQQFYAGDQTLMAAKLRDVWLRSRLQGGSAATWLATVLGVLIGGKAPLPKQDRGAQDFARGFLSGLGFDPDTHTLSRTNNCFGRGMVVRDSEDRPVFALREKQIKKLMNDPLMMSGYAEEVEA